MFILFPFSENTPEGRKITKLDQILLNGNNITMLIPGGEYPYYFNRIEWQVVVIQVMIILVFVHFIK